MRRRKHYLWPDYMSRETLAARLDIEPGYVDQLVTRGRLPRPVTLGEAERWRWTDVEKFIRTVDDGGESHADRDDPYLAGIERLNGTTKESHH